MARSRVFTANSNLCDIQGAIEEWAHALRYPCAVLICGWSCYANSGGNLVSNAGLIAVITTLAVASFLAMALRLLFTRPLFNWLSLADLFNVAWDQIQRHNDLVWYYVISVVMFYEGCVVVGHFLSLTLALVDKLFLQYSSSASDTPPEWSVGSLLEEHFHKFVSIPIIDVFWKNKNKDETWTQFVVEGKPA